MENLLQEFPHLAKRIFDQLDVRRLNRCKEISGEVLEFLDNERFFWIRIIMKYKRKIKDFTKLWKQVFDKTPVEKVKQIAIAISKFHNDHHLYSHHFIINRCWSFKQWSLIAVSAHHDDLALIQFIVRKIKLKNIKQVERINALFLAAYKGNLEVYDFLTSKLRDKKPGKTSLLNREGRTPLHWAANNGHFGLCKLIIEGTGNKNPGTIKNIPKYRRKYPEAAEGSTPLHLAAHNGHLEVCKLIMDNIKDKDPANIEGETPFHFAAKEGQLAVCQLILENVSDKNPRGWWGITPLHYAAQYGHVELCKVIMENLVDKNPRCSDDTTPLSLAMDHKKPEVCQLFHENGIH
jgi:ankyrin repeat protein